MTTLLALLNPASGPDDGLANIIDALRSVFDEDPDWDVYYQLSLSKEDACKKIMQAEQMGFDAVLVAGGDGMINSCLSPLMETGLTLYVLPTGSVNGFARHFEIPLEAEDALIALKSGRDIFMDIGFANDRPFSVTCSFAWEVEIVETFEKLKIRGVLPYILSAVMTGIGYDPQTHILRLGDQEIKDHNPLVMTVANVTEYGEMKLIAPPTSIQDGKLELIRVDRDAMGSILTHLKKITNETAYELKDIKVDSVSEVTIIREQDSPIQVDGELVDESAEVHVTVRERALRVRVPEGYVETATGVE